MREKKRKKRRESKTKAKGKREEKEEEIYGMKWYCIDKESISCGWEDGWLIDLIWIKSLSKKNRLGQSQLKSGLIRSS